MIAKAERPVRIDLSAFKLHVRLETGRAFTLHFNTPSRRFYLSLIAFLVSRMKGSGTISSVALEEHLDLLVLLNETVGESAGSSDRDNLLGRIYRKWKSALPDLAKAPLFRVLGKAKTPESQPGKPPSFSEAELDLWANLFEYTGSEENVRLRFSVDRIGLGPDDVLISWQGERDLEAWGGFVSELRRTRPGPKSPDVRRDGAELAGTVRDAAEPSKSVPRRPHGRRAAFAAGVLVLGLGVAATAWKMSTVAPSAVLVTAAGRLPFPDKPSIAVLPFANMSGDPGEDFLVDGITDSIITALSAEPGLFVIARNSTFTYKGRAIDVRRVAESLGVQYVLEGGVQKSGERLRITAQLIDSTRGNHLWSETYDRDLEDIFAVQDDIILKILTALQVELTVGEQARVWAKGTGNVRAYLKRLQAIDQWYQMNAESNALARKLAEESVSSDPNYAGAYTTLAATYILDILLVSSSSQSSLEKAISLNKKALDLDESLPQAHSQLGYLYTMTGQHDKGVIEATRGVELDPNSAGGHDLLGMALMYAGRPEDAIPSYKKAIRLHPLAPGKYYYHLAHAYLLAGRCSEALAACEEALRRAGNNLFAHLTATVVFGTCGEEERSREAAEGVLRISPCFSCDDYSKRIPYKNSSDTDRYVAALRRAGLN